MSTSSERAAQSGKVNARNSFGQRIRQLQEYPNNLEAGRLYVSVMRQAQSYEDKVAKRLRKSPREIIDFDVAPIRTLQIDPIRNRGTADHMLALISSVLDTSTLDGEYLHDTIEARRAYSLALQEGRLVVPFEEYVSSVVGVIPEMIPEREIGEKVKDVADIFSELGYPYTEEGWEQYNQIAKICPEEVKETFEQLRPSVVKAIREAASLSGIDPAFEFRLVDVDEPWVNWILGTRLEYLLKVNANKRNENRFVDGTPQALVAHENFHAQQIGGWRVGIDRKVRPLNAGYGITSVPAPIQWCSEGAATAAIDLVPKLQSIIGKRGMLMARRQQTLRKVYNNAQIEISRPGADQEKIVSQVESYLPGEPRDKIIDNLKRARYSPKQSAYDVCYQDGYIWFDRAIKGWPKEEVAELLHAICSIPMTPNQIKRRAWRELESPTLNSI